MKIEKINIKVMRKMPIAFVGIYILFFPFAFFAVRKLNWSIETCLSLFVYTILGISLLYSCWSIFFYSVSKEEKRLVRIGSIVLYSDLAILLTGAIIVFNGFMTGNVSYLIARIFEATIVLTVVTIIAYAIIKLIMWVYKTKRAPK